MILEVDKQAKTIRIVEASLIELTDLRFGPEHAAIEHACKHYKLDSDMARRLVLAARREGGQR